MFATGPKIGTGNSVQVCNVGDRARVTRAITVASQDLHIHESRVRKQNQLSNQGTLIRH